MHDTREAAGAERPARAPASRRTGLVLAAGYGARQPRSLQSVPKPLLPVAGRPILLRTLDSLVLAGCNSAIVVIGHEGAKVQAAIERDYEGSMNVAFVNNPRFDLQNGISVLAAAPDLPEEFVLAMADHVFDACTMSLIATHSCRPGTATLVIDRKLDSIFDIDDATKVFVRDDRVERIGKQLDAFNAIDCGLFVAGPSLLAALEDVFRTRGDASLSEGVQTLASAGAMTALDLGGCRWQDVDTPEMLEEAERLLRYSQP